jgi:thioredoxin 1
MAVNVNDANFNEVVKKSDKPVLVDFWAQWCGPCRMIAPIVEELATEMDGKAVIVKCDVDSSNIAADYGIRNIPTLLFFKNGEVVDKIVGSTSKAVISAKLNSLL